VGLYKERCTSQAVAEALAKRMQAFYHFLFRRAQLNLFQQGNKVELLIEF
jgi:hypothetical protein